jgi:hypothetical protein
MTRLTSKMPKRCLATWTSDYRDNVLKTRIFPHLLTSAVGTTDLAGATTSVRNLGVNCRGGRVRGTRSQRPRRATLAIFQTS